VVIQKLVLVDVQFATMAMMVLADPNVPNFGKSFDCSSPSALFVMFCLIVGLARKFTQTCRGLF
jgi:hypothetical protein